MTRTYSLSIEALGQKGDGLAHLDGEAVHVPFALPGEQVLVEIEGSVGRLVAVEKASPARIPPVCPLFQSCGGCSMQHLAASLYGDWKRELVLKALSYGGIEYPVAVPIAAYGAGRRRVTLHTRFDQGKAISGFMASRSHKLVEIDTCPILVSGLERSSEVASALAQALSKARKPLDVAITKTSAGLDVDIRGHGPVSPSLRQYLAREAERLDLARLSIHGDPIIIRRPPIVQMGTASVVLPPGSFLQATELGEETLASLVVNSLSGAKSVADLFCGVGPFALRLAKSSKVHAVDSDQPAIGALDRAARETSDLRPLTTEARDLFRRPLLAQELNAFDALVFDPPRVGAEAQALEIARSNVRLVAAVSCNSTSFARDARILIDGGYKLSVLTLVDQFLYSAHIELVGIFEKKPETKRPRRLLG
jgi:23S rRNA (uracil1939-C5)-methyltransferase